MSECIWKEKTSYEYDTGCDNIFTIMEGTPKDNGFKYCPYCGKALKEKQPEWDEIGIGDTYREKESK